MTAKAAKHMKLDDFYSFCSRVSTPSRGLSRTFIHCQSRYPQKLPLSALVISISHPKLNATVVQEASWFVLACGQRPERSHQPWVWRALFEFPWAVYVLGPGTLKLKIELSFHGCSMSQIKVDEMPLSVPNIKVSPLPCLWG